MKKSIVLLLFFGLLLTVRVSPAAEETGVSEEVKTLANDVIVGIYKDILAEKSKYKELADFDEKVLYENKYGIYALVYKYEKYKDDKIIDFYEFGVTVLKLQDQMFADQGPYAFNIGFPRAGLKFAGYFKRDLRRRQFDLSAVINKYGFYLDQYQQRFMPLKLLLRPVKPAYQIEEPIQFEVELKNASLNHMYVKSLDSNSLFCLFNNKAWGAKQTGYEGSKTVVLRAGESIFQNFVGESISKPGEVPIFCTYSLSIDGVQPSGTLNVKVSAGAPSAAKALP